MKWLFTTNLIGGATQENVNCVDLYRCIDKCRNVEQLLTLIYYVLDTIWFYMLIVFVYVGVYISNFHLILCLCEEHKKYVFFNDFLFQTNPYKNKIQPVTSQNSQILYCGKSKDVAGLSMGVG